MQARLKISSEIDFFQSLGRLGLGGILRGNLGEGNCESNIAARQ